MNKINSLKKFNKINILIIGDMVADVYLKGNISRVSREAPVLVLEHAGEKVVPGGAANVVHNVATLGGQAFAVGLIGNDKAGSGLRDILNDKNVDTTGLIVEENRPTITKTRIIAGGSATVSQQIVRIDQEMKSPILSQTEKNLINILNQVIDKIDAVVLSDYGSGMLSDKIRSFIIESCQEKNIKTIVDSRYDILKFNGVSFVKQNEAEAAKAVGFELTSEDAVVTAGKILLEKLQAEGIIISRGEQGMSLIQDNGEIHHIPVVDKSEVFDVSGAGDTAVAAFILAIASGAKPVEATKIANFAAGIAVRKLGTATVSNEELKEVLGEYYVD